MADLRFYFAFLDSRHINRFAIRCQSQVQERRSEENENMETENGHGNVLGTLKSFSVFLFFFFFSPLSFHFLIPLLFFSDLRYVRFHSPLVHVHSYTISCFVLFHFFFRLYLFYFISIFRFRSFFSSKIYINPNPFRIVFISSSMFFSLMTPRSASVNRFSTPTPTSEIHPQHIPRRTQSVRAVCRGAQRFDLLVRAQS